MEHPNPIPFPFRCPISMELMLDPVTVSTGVTYDRANIERWLFTYKKRTCPATMQPLTCLDLTPNLTLRRLIQTWASPPSSSSSSSLATDRPDISDLLHQIESVPFKLGPLRRLRRLVGADEKAREELVGRGGVEVVGGVMLKLLEECGELEDLEACEEAVGVLQLLPLRGERETRFLTRKESLGSMVLMMQRGSAEARLHAVVILQKIVKTSRDLSREMGEQQGIEFYKSLLELLSDEISTHASVAALDVLIEILTSSKRTHVKAVEAGAVFLVVELLPDAGKHKCEKLLLLLKLLCKCPEGRAAFVDHALGMAAVSKKIMRVSEVATKLAVKILWVVCSSLPFGKVLEEMVVVGAVKKMLALLHVGGRSSTKEMVIRVVRMHGGVWQQYPCFPGELRDYLRMVEPAPN